MIRVNFNNYIISIIFVYYQYKYSEKILYKCRFIWVHRSVAESQDFG